MSEPKTTVYRFFAADDTALYVGISKSGARRMVQHAQAAWWPQVAYCWFAHYDDHDEALLVERRLIETLKPTFNRAYRLPSNGRPPQPEQAA